MSTCEASLTLLFLQVALAEEAMVLLQAIQLLHSRGSPCVFLVNAGGGPGASEFKLPSVLEDAPVPVVILDAAEELDSKSQTYSICSGIVVLVSPGVHGGSEVVGTHLPADQNTVFVSSGQPQWTDKFAQIKRMTNTLLFSRDDKQLNESRPSPQGHVQFRVYSKPNYFSADLDKVGVFDGNQYIIAKNSSLDFKVCHGIINLYQPQGWHIT